jgi:hypothetical protein
MNKITKKIVATVMTVAFSVMLVGDAGAALTESQIQSILGLLESFGADTATVSNVNSALRGEATEGTPATGETITACVGVSFDRHLQQGMSGTDVKCLQAILNLAADTQVATSGAGAPGSETEYFGALTKAAVVNFQEKFASTVLNPLGLAAGTGYVGNSTIAKLNTLKTTAASEEPSEEPVEETPVTGTASVSLASDTPEAAQVALNSQDAMFTKVRVSGGSNGVTISRVVVTRGGISADADIASVKLFDGNTQIGSTQALNTTTHKATFTGLNWQIPAGQVKYLTIKGSIAASGTATVGDSVRLGVALSSDITSTGTITGTFPIYGNAKTIAGISVGYLDVAKRTTPATTTMLSGATDQEIASWTFTASSTEGFDVTSIAITHVGSATRDEVQNIKIKVDGVQVGATGSLNSQNKVVFDLSASPLKINAGSSKTVYAYADIASGIWTSRTIIFEIAQYTDVTAYGANSGGSVTITTATWTAYARQTGNTMTIGQGLLTVAVDAASNPSAQNYVKGTENRTISAFKFSAGSTEGARITELKLTLTGAVTDIANVTLWDGSTQIGSASVIGSYVTFGSNTIGWDTTGLFDIQASQSKTVLVKADIPSGAVQSNTVKLYVGSASDVKADGLSSMYDIASGSITATSAGTSYVNAHTIAASGNLTLSKASQSPAAQTYVKGSTDKEFLRINFQADGGEDINVSSLTVYCYTGDSMACASNYVTNMRVLKADGSQFGSTSASPTASASFSGTLAVPASETISLRVLADVPSTSNATSGGVYFTIAGASDVTSTGVYSAADIGESGFAVTGSTMPIGSGTLTIAVAASPADQTVIKGATQVSLVGFVFTAGSSEDIRVNQIILKGVGLAGASDRTDLSNIALYDGSTKLTINKSWDSSATSTTFSTSDFFNYTGFVVAKGQQKTITVKADVPSTATIGHKVGIGISSSTDQVVAVGLSSYTTLTTGSDLIITLGGSTGGVNYSTNGAAAEHYATINQGGSLTAVRSADSPEIGIVAVGSGLADTTFLKVDLRAELEDSVVKAITLERLYNADKEFSYVSLWDGSTQLGGNQTLVGGVTTFNFPAGSYWTIPAGTTKTLTVKAGLNGVESQYQVGVSSGAAPAICLSTSTAYLAMTVEGASSGNTIGVTELSGTAGDICGNYQILHKSKPVLASATLPSTTYGAGVKTLYRWTVTADSKGEIGWKKAVFSVSGSVSVASADSRTLGMGTSAGDFQNNLILMGTSTFTGVTAIDTFEVWDVTNNTQVSASAPQVYHGGSTGGAKVIFIATNEQIVAAGQTKTYELKGTTAYAGYAGDSVTTNIAALSAATSTAAYSTVAIGTGYSAATSTDASFVWSDRSGDTTAAHSAATADWTNDYKVSGIPTTTLLLTR